MQTDKELKDLLGEHWLDAVDSTVEQVHDYGEHFNDATALRFRLNGIAYTVIEDPDDGYRSSLGQLFTSNGADMKNVFNPVWVVGRWKEHNLTDDGPSDIIELVDLWTARVVIEVGTNYSDDYYPSFVACFSPENMIHNLPESD